MPPTGNCGEGSAAYYRDHYPLTAEAPRGPVAQPRQRRRVEALPRAEGRAGGPDGDARTLCVQRPAALPARARAGAGGRAGRPGAAPWSSATSGPAGSDRWPPPTSSTRPSWATCCRWPASSSSRAPRPRPAPASRTPPSTGQPGNQQAITCCFAVEYREGEDHTIDRSGRVCLLAGLCPRAAAVVARAAAGPDVLAPADAQVRHPRLRPARRRARPVGLPTDRSIPATSGPARIPAARGSRW